MIYLDTSVVLAQLLVEDRRPPEVLWGDSLIASRLLEYETWTRLNARGLAETHGGAATELLARVAMVEMLPPVLSRALEAFPTEVRTLDALHLATIQFLIGARQNVSLATYDERMLRAARALGFPVFDLP
ncbi:PIN domain-containing protein [bacterium CPR1]|nr:PIN domain-containing protein [bacterium CPR1]